MIYRIVKHFHIIIILLVRYSYCTQEKYFAINIITSPFLHLYHVNLQSTQPKFCSNLEKNEEYREDLRSTKQTRQIRSDCGITKTCNVCCCLLYLSTRFGSWLAFWSVRRTSSERQTKRRGRQVEKNIPLRFLLMLLHYLTDILLAHDKRIQTDKPTR